MKIELKHILITLVFVIGLIAANVYQYRNPQVVEIPAGQTAIDSTAWVKRTTYLSRQQIIDSLRSENQALAERIRQATDQIASYTKVTGRLQMKLDSLQSRPVNGIPLTRLLLERDNRLVADTTFQVTKIFGDGLFSVTATAKFRDDLFTLDVLPPVQLRPVNINVVTTINEDRYRILTYLESPDFEELEYESYTELQSQREVPKFWLGVGTGVLGTFAIKLILK